MGTPGSRTTVLTLRLDEASMSFFENLRRQHFPPALNRIPAHLTLFHQFPLDDDVFAALKGVAESQPPFRMQISGLRSLGRGVAYTLESGEARTLHGHLAGLFQAWLTPQDRQGFRPHIVVQNKTTSEDARMLLTTLQATFRLGEATATGLDWWEYLGGPWKLLHHFPFEGRSEEKIDE